MLANEPLPGINVPTGLRIVKANEEVVKEKLVPSLGWGDKVLSPPCRVSKKLAKE